MNFGNYRGKDKRTRQKTGSFYTPRFCVEKSTQYLRECIKRVKTKDYIILDRFAGEGNLERLLTDEELSHVVMNTIQPEEHEFLKFAFGDKIRKLYEPMDSLSREFIEDEYLQNIVKDSDCTVILYENPPYVSSVSIENQKAKGAKEANWRNEYIGKLLADSKVLSRDIVNACIWTGFEIYRPEFYIVYAPIKYWKADHIIDKKALSVNPPAALGFVADRREFGASIGTVSCICWTSEENTDKDYSFELEVLDAKSTQKAVGRLNQAAAAVSGIPGSLSGLKLVTTVKARRIWSNITDCYPEYPEHIAHAQPDCVVDYSGTPTKAMTSCPAAAVCYLLCNSTEFNNPRLHVGLFSHKLNHGGGVYLLAGNYKAHLPLFCAGEYAEVRSDDFLTYGFRMKSADGWEPYRQDVMDGKLDEFLDDCLVFACIFGGRNHTWGTMTRNVMLSDYPSFPYKELMSRGTIHKYDKILEPWRKIQQQKLVSETFIVSSAVTVYDVKTRLKDSKEIQGLLKELKDNAVGLYEDRILPVLFRYKLVV